MVVKKAVKKETQPDKRKYFEGVGRRKTAVARVRFFPSSKAGEGLIVNGLLHEKYFPLIRFQQAAVAPFRVLKDKKGEAVVSVKGGGIMAQSDAIKLGLARALVKFDPDLKKELRAFGYLTRDPRMVERKKYGLKKARRAPQWTKR